MKKKLVLGLAILAIALIMACNSGEPLKTYTYEPITTKPTMPETTTTEEVTTEIYVAPIGEEQRLEIGKNIEKLVVPAYFELGNVKGNSLIDTWTQGGYVKVGEAIVEYDGGDPIFVLLYNGSDETCEYQLQIVNAPKAINHSDCTGKDYVQAPDGFMEWVTLSETIVSVGSKCARAVPFVIHIADGVELPEQWEFRILITDYPEGRYSTAHEIRIFITSG